MSTEKSVGSVIKDSMGDVISQELADKIDTMFQEAVNTQVEARIKLVVENELDKQDEAHSEQLESLLESIDTDHLEKTKKLLSAMDENYSKKLLQYADKMNKELNENAEAFQKALKESISQFLDSYIDSVIPMKTIEEAVQNTRSARMIDKIKDVIGIDPAFVSKSIKSAVMEAKDHMDEMEKKISTLTESNTELQTKLEETTRKLVLEEKTAGLSQEKRDFIRRRLGDRSVKEIEANYEYVCEMFDADQREKRQEVRESAEQKTKTVTSKIDKPRDVLKENVEDKSMTTDHDDVSACLDILKSL